MGFYLLHEGMLDSVIYARDKFLKPDGLMFPSESTIFVAPCSVPSLFEYWEDVDGVRLTAFASKLREQKSSKPEIAQISEKDLLHNGVAMHWMNLLDVSAEELDHLEFQDVLSVTKAGKHQGYCIWFDCRFPGESYEESIVLSTGPKVPVTHWKQCIVVLPENACEEVEENTPVSFKISMKRKINDNRKYDLEVEILDPNEVEHPIPCDCHLTKCILTKAHLQTMDTSY